MITFIKYLTLVLFSFATLTSCKTGKLISNDVDDSFSEKNLRLPRVSVDEVGTIYVDDKGSPKDIATNEIVELCTTDDVYTLKPNKNYQFEFVNFNPKNLTLATKITENGDILLKVVDINVNKVVLNKKCEFEIWETTTIPNIEVPKDSKEQIVITPLFKDGCIHYGYEIRLGSTETGCNKKVILDKLAERRKCSGQDVKKNKIYSLKDYMIKVK